jgi:hypothetical protein
MSSLRTLGTLFLMSILLAGCLLPRPPAPGTPEETPTPSGPVSESGKGGWLDWDGKGGWTGSERKSLGAAGDDGMVFKEEIAEEAPAALDAEAPRDEAGVPMPTVDTANQQPGALRAGEVDDNAEWDDYLLYRMNYTGQPVHDRDVSERYVVTVNDARARPLLDAGVTFYVADRPVFSGRTYATGQVLFFPRALGVTDDVLTFRVVAEKDGTRREANLIRGEDYEITLDLDHPGRTEGEPAALDVLFLIDATGSMSDEIQKLQESIQSIATRIDRLPSKPEVRFAMTIYRDRGDLFVSRTYDFTPDVKQFSAALDEVRADGGGDTPESLNEALHQAVFLPEWRGEDAVQLIFLVADAAPHLDYDQDDDYAADMQTAAERGIKIFSVASSGLDDQGEYIFRQIAQFTQGRFIFLTYGPGGAPGDSTTHHVEDYSVQNLDDLVVRLVEEELAHQE